MNTRSVRQLICVWGFLACVAQGLTEESIDVESLLDSMDPEAITQMVSNLLPQACLSNEVIWDHFYTQVRAVLQSGTVENAALMLSLVDAACGSLNETPEAQPLVEWLQQKREYFAMADAMMRDAWAEPSDIASLGPSLPLIPPYLVPNTLTYAATAAAQQPNLTPTVALVQSLVADENRWKKQIHQRQNSLAFHPLVSKLKTVFASEGVPSKWIWIAEVESTFNPKARSPSGAVGLFQLMPDTARRFGLKLFPFDDRLTPEKSARAAAQYLKTLHDQFGSWHLALAAYNAGEGRVLRTLKDRKVSTFAQVSRYLPLETQMYVPRVMATVSLREDQRSTPALNTDSVVTLRQRRVREAMAN